MDELYKQSTDFGNIENSANQPLTNRLILDWAQTLPDQPGRILDLAAGAGSEATILKQSGFGAGSRPDIFCRWQF